MKKKKELTPQEVIDLFDRCVTTLCTCQSPEQKFVAGRYVSFAARRVSEDTWDQEMWVKAIYKESLKHTIPKKGGGKDDNKEQLHSNCRVLCKDDKVTEGE